MVKKPRKGKHRKDQQESRDKSSFASWTRLGLIAVHVYDVLREFFADVL